MGRYGDGILEPIKIKSQDKPFGFGFKPIKKDFKSMIAQRREKRRVRAAGQTAETPLRIPHLFETFPALYCNYQP